MTRHNIIIDSQKILYSLGNNDECWTPKEAVTPILKYIPQNATIWCPFDTETSRFVQEISKTNPVTYSSIHTGQNFYTYEPPQWDILISNPPFTNKRKIFERALSFGKPFALIMSNTWLNDAAPKQLFKHHELQLLMFEERIKFITPGQQQQNKITFSSSYYCHKFLPKQIIMTSLKTPQ